VSEIRWPQAKENRNAWDIFCWEDSVDHSAFQDPRQWPREIVIKGWDPATWQLCREKHILETCPRPTETLGWDPAICISTSLPDDSDAS
jgi:hypothetical protein